jgi:hypothetical protein
VFGAQMSKVITVCDHEADIFAYLSEKQGHNERYVVRAKHMRKVQDTKLNLFNHLSAQPYHVDLPQKGEVGKRRNRPLRRANLTVRSAKVSL